MRKLLVGLLIIGLFAIGAFFLIPAKTEKSNYGYKPLSLGMTKQEILDSKACSFRDYVTELECNDFLYEGVRVELAIGPLNSEVEKDGNGTYIWKKGADFILIRVPIELSKKTYDSLVKKYGEPSKRLTPGWGISYYSFDNDHVQLEDWKVRDDTKPTNLYLKSSDYLNRKNSH